MPLKKTRKLKLTIPSPKPRVSSAQLFLIKPIIPGVLGLYLPLVRSQNRLGECIPHELASFIHHSLHFHCCIYLFIYISLFSSDWAPSSLKYHSPLFSFLTTTLRSRLGWQFNGPSHLINFLDKSKDSNPRSSRVLVQLSIHYTMTNLMVRTEDTLVLSQQLTMYSVP